MLGATRYWRVLLGRGRFVAGTDAAGPYDFAMDPNSLSPEGPVAPATVKTEHATGVPLPTPWSEQAVDSAESLDLPESLPPDPGAPPIVAPEQWLDEPRYWLADYQHVPRPKTRPLTRPTRFRKASPVKSAITLLFAIVLVVVLTIGLALVLNAGVQAGSKFIQQFTTPATPLVTPQTSPVPTVTVPASK